jgi:hypothetical protein
MALAALGHGIRPLLNRIRARRENGPTASSLAAHAAHRACRSPAGLGTGRLSLPFTRKLPLLEAGTAEHRPSRHEEPTDVADNSLQPLALLTMVWVVVRSAGNAAAQCIGSFVDTRVPTKAVTRYPRRRALRLLTPHLITATTASNAPGTKLNTDALQSDLRREGHAKIGQHRMPRPSKPVTQAARSVNR